MNDRSRGSAHAARVDHPAEPDRLAAESDETVAKTHDARPRGGDAATDFPDQNPNPVLRIDGLGILRYANPASRDIVHGLGLVIDEPVPGEVLSRLRQGLDVERQGTVDLQVGSRIFDVRSAAASGSDAVTVYATDVSAVRAVERFPERNPNPVLRISDVGVLLYANRAAEPLVAALGLVAGRHLPPGLADRLLAADATGDSEPIEVQGDGHWYELHGVRIPEMGFLNVYGTDVTAMRALRRFPQQNPNPVMRVSGDGVLLFANPASRYLVEGLGLVEGQPLPADLLVPVRSGLERGDCRFEVEAAGRLYRMLGVAAFEFGFINLYATDITAARQVEEAHAENERLLLNILPEPIAQRLRAGERIIADRHEDLSLLFADIVGFTRLSSQLEPEQVIDLLDGLFRDLDGLVDTYDLEKIKTIGDAYMVVGGLPPRANDHLVRVASMALDLTDLLHSRTADPPLHMRIGLHAGPAVAGVIGTRKFIYDVWGDTVNTASRLESEGVPDRIQVTDAVRDRLDDAFLFEPRGTIELKGMGPTRTWFLGRRRRAVHPSVALA
jgi:class 3 adenylate cyclase